MDYSEAGCSRASIGMATAALVLAILSIITGLFVYLAVPLGALAVILGLLSRGDGRMFTRSKAAIILSVFSMIGSSAVTGYAFYTVYSDPALKTQVEEMVDYYLDLYGIPDSQEETLPSFILPESEAPAPVPSQPEQDIPMGGSAA